MKKLLSLLLLPLILFSSCDWRVQANIFSGLKNIDNLTVLEAISSGDDDVMTAVYERETLRLASLSATEDRVLYNEVRLGIADLQAVRSRGILIFLVLIAIEVLEYEVEEVINDSVVEQFIYEVVTQVDSVLRNAGSPTATQLFMAVLGILVWWYYVAVDLGITPSEIITQYKAGTLSSFIDIDDTEKYEDMAELEGILDDNITTMENMLDNIMNNPELMDNPELKQAVENTYEIFGLNP